MKQLLAGLIWVSVWALGAALAEQRSIPELDLATQRYLDEISEVAGEKREAAIAELSDNYLTAIARELDAAQQAGRLEDALILKKESSLVAEGGVPEQDDPETPDELKRLRVIYRARLEMIDSEAESATSPVTKRFAATLDKLVLSLTQAGRLEDALAVKQRKDGLALKSIGTLRPAPKSAPEGTFVNSLGMTFVPVTRADVLFCVHETRRIDYASYADAVPGVDGAWKNQNRGGIPAGLEDDHPVVGVNWADAQGFCEWLSKKEGRVYRLPTDREWSFAVDIGRKEKSGLSPGELSHKVSDEFPWGSRFPPTQPVGNYADESMKEQFSGFAILEGYKDGFATTSPVMVFPPNKFGIYDLGGNVLEWCEDWYDHKKIDRVTRGGAWTKRVEVELLSSHRDHTPPGRRDPAYGFRCVVEEAD